MPFERHIAFYGFVLRCHRDSPLNAGKQPT
jgi:hypothetical protein